MRLPYNSFQTGEQRGLRFLIGQRFGALLLCVPPIPPVPLKTRHNYSAKFSESFSPKSGEEGMNRLKLMPKGFGIKDGQNKENLTRKKQQQ
jgi:hypothetical protein